jgi:HSP20 family protein
MSSLTRIDPVDSLFGDLMKGFFVRPMGLPVGSAEAGVPAIRLDVQESDKAYQVLADIPGVNKDDIKVTVDGGVVTIAAQSRKESERKEGERVVYRERAQGAVSRSFSLAQEVDAAAADARYENGVLALNLPKKQSRDTRRVAVQ